MKVSVPEFTGARSLYLVAVSVSEVAKCPHPSPYKSIFLTIRTW